MHGVLALFIAWNVSAGEPDNFSARRDSDAPVVNSEINRVVNTVIDLAIQDSSPASKPNCNRARLMKYLEDDLDRNLPRINNSVMINTPVAGPRLHTDVPYRSGKPYTELYFSQSYKVKAQGKTFYVGVDKIDHFFSHGSMYWDIIGKDPALPKDKVLKALEIGVMQENATWGLKNTGVKSYGDLAANYKGLLFWRDFFDGKPAFIVCKNGRFVKNREFDLADYFDESMDESINCSSFATEEIKNAITGVTNRWKMTCPAVGGACERLQKNFGELSPYLLHPRCAGTGTAILEPASPMTTKDVIDTAQAVR